VCPLHTTSSAGSYSRANCICDPGFQCTYYKQIQAIVTLNATLWEFQNDINGVRTAFIAAMAAAAGVHSSQVTINDVVSQNRRRRLLALPADDQPVPDGMQQVINVHASVLGAVHLRDLDKHLNRHSPTLHVSHSWEQAQRVMAVPMGPLVPATKPPVMKPAVIQEAMKTREVKKAKAIELMNRKFLEDMLAK